MGADFDPQVARLMWSMVQGEWHGSQLIRLVPAEVIVGPSMELPGHLSHLLCVMHVPPCKATQAALLLGWNGRL